MAKLSNRIENLELNAKRQTCSTPEQRKERERNTVCIRVPEGTEADATQRLERAIVADEKIPLIYSWEGEYSPRPSMPDYFQPHNMWEVPTRYFLSIIAEYHRKRLGPSYDSPHLIKRPQNA